MSKEKFYIIIDLISNNSCLWDSDDNFKEFGDRHSNKIYYAYNKAKVGADAIAALNILIDHARNNLDLEPIVLLAIPKGSRNKMPGVMIKNLRDGGLHNCEIFDWSYLHLKQGSFGKAVSLKMYHDEKNKKEGFFDMFHSTYARKSNNVCVITKEQEINIEPILGGLSYRQFLRDDNMIVVKSDVALDPSDAVVFVTNNLAQYGINPSKIIKGPQNKQEEEIAILSAESLERANETTSVVDEEVELAEIVEDGFEPEK